MEIKRGVSEYLFLQNKKYLDNRIVKELEEVKIVRNLKILDCKKTKSKTIEVYQNEQKILLHSKYDPWKEAECFANNDCLELYRDIVLVGFGCGYHVQVLLKRLKSKYQKLWIIVVNPDIFKLTLQINNLIDIISDERVNIIFSSKPDLLNRKIKAMLTQITGRESKLIFHYPSLKVMPDTLVGLRDILERIDIDRRSYERQKDILFSNIKDNVDNVIKAVPLCYLQNVFENFPVFIVAAGPSLDRNYHQLARVCKKGIIICVGTVVKKLLKQNIKPDFIVIIDGNLPIYYQLNGYWQLDIPLLFIPGANSKAINEYQGPKIVAFPDNDEFYQRLNETLKKGGIKTGGSVATAALDFGRQLGGNPLVFVGQDLALNKEGRTHARGTKKKGWKASFIKWRQVEGIDGEKVPTLKNLYLYLRWFENYIKEYPEIEFIDATEGGAKIKGTKIMKLKDVIDLYCTREVDFYKIKEIINKYKPVYSIDELEEVRKIVCELDYV